MEHITSRPKVASTPSEMEEGVFFNLWQKKLWPYKMVSVGDILYWYEASSGKILWRTRVVVVDKFEYDDLKDAGDQIERKFGPFDRKQHYFNDAHGRGFCLVYKVSPVERMSIPKPDGLRFPHQGWLRVDSVAGRKWLGIRGAAEPPAALPLTVHERYSRHEIYGAVGIRFSAQNRSQIVGLSPRCPDGGYILFITLNKESYPPTQDYDDQLYSDRLLWITRRGRGEGHEDYVRLRQPDTRVSLFVRNSPGEGFVYAGELEYDRHREIPGKSRQETQQSYSWRLKVSLPDELLLELTFGHAKRRQRMKPGKPRAGRNPVDLSEFKKAFHYALGTLDRTVVPEHHNYQVRLQRFLVEKGLRPEFERDYLDVSFELSGQRYIGEIKVTRYLSLSEAFRTALGQLLEYAHVRFEEPPRMVMFLDQPLDAQRLKLAAQLKVAVVVGHEDSFRLMGDGGSHVLVQFFD